MKSKKIIGVFLICFLLNSLLGNLSPVYASDTSILAGTQAANKTLDVNPTVLALGDSIAFGVNATAGNDYVSLLYNHLLTIPTYSQLSLNNLAVSGDTSGKLLARLQTSEYIEAVKNARIITLSVGGNNLLSPVIGAVCMAFGVNQVNNPNMMSDLAQAMATNPNKDTILASLANSPTLAQALQSGVSQFGADFPQIISTIKTLTPQAEIYILNLYNPFYAQDPLYKVFDPLVNGINQVLKNNTPVGYKIADVYTEFKATPGAVNFNLATIQLDPHPTNVGHAAIYQAILDVESGQIPGTYYTVSVGTLTGGSITASPISEKPGATINLTISPNPGMQLQAGTLKYNDGTTDHVISGTSFIMPEANVTVTAVFEEVIIYPAKFNVPTNKTWTITFNAELDLSITPENYILITDSQKKAVINKVAFGSDCKSIIINPPQGGYTPGEEYSLTIAKGFLSKTGKLMKRSYRMQFSVVEP